MFIWVGALPYHAVPPIMCVLVLFLWFRLSVCFALKFFMLSNEISLSEKREQKKTNEQTTKRADEKTGFLCYPICVWIFVVLTTKTTMTTYVGRVWLVIIFWVIRTQLLFILHLGLKKDNRKAGQNKNIALPMREPSNGNYANFRLIQSGIKVVNGHLFEFAPAIVGRTTD